jgi:hypothetical protein
MFRRVPATGLVSVFFRPSGVRADGSLERDFVDAPLDRVVVSAPRLGAGRCRLLGADVVSEPEQPIHGLAVAARNDAASALKPLMLMRIRINQAAIATRIAEASDRSGGLVIAMISMKVRRLTPVCRRISASSSQNSGSNLQRRLVVERVDTPAVHLCTSERGAPFTTAGFARTVERAGNAAKLGFKAHPHMLRHACGFALANKGHDTRALQAYLGHRNIQHTVRYTELAPTRFKDFWRE